jgi:hypothetical protein
VRLRGWRVGEFSGRAPIPPLDLVAASACITQCSGEPIVITVLQNGAPITVDSIHRPSDEKSPIFESPVGTPKLFKFRACYHVLYMSSWKAPSAPFTCAFSFQRCACDAKHETQDISTIRLDKRKPSRSHGRVKVKRRHGFGSPTRSWTASESRLKRGIVDLGYDASFQLCSCFSLPFPQHNLTQRLEAHIVRLPPTNEREREAHTHSEVSASIPCHRLQYAANNPCANTGIARAGTYRAGGPVS